ncbi:adenosylmethionine decarboxylase [Pelagibacteraceae bacterium]|nr:adenosylmethionine decarboxylase [Pelagibacteraceae bacterium]
MIKVGEHITLDFLGVKNDYAPSFYEKIIYKIAKAAKVEILNVSSHKFEPQGFTLVALLSESHFSFHTFPEKGVISFDFFTCGKVQPKIALKILKKEIQHERVVTNSFNRSSVSLYDDIYSTSGQKKYYVVNDVLETFTSKVGQFVEIMNLEEFGNALFIDHEIQVAEKDEKIYSSNFFKSSYDLSKKNTNIAIIGGGDGGVARECLENNANYIDWYELDPEIVESCYRHLPKVCSKVKKSNRVNTYWGDAFESIKSVEDSKYDKIFVDLNDDQYCIDLAKKNMKGLKRILKKGGVITAQVGSLDKKPKQVANWTNVLNKSFGNVKVSGIYIPSFDCNWNFASSIMK